MSLFDTLTKPGGLTQMLGSAIGGGSSSVLGIDIGSSAIKVVQLRKEKGAAVLETYGELSLGPYADIEIGRATNLDADKLAEALKDILKEANVTTANCGVPISEVQLDWFVVPSGETKFLSGVDKKGQDEQSEATQKNAEKMLVLLVAIHTEVLRKYNTVLRAANLTPTFYEIEIFSSIRAALGRGIAPVAILDIGAAHTKLYIVEYGIVRTSHVINKGSQDITLSLANISNVPISRAEELKRELGLLGGAAHEQGATVVRSASSTIDFILAEAHRAVLAYQRKNNTNISQLILTGGGSTLKGFHEIAQKKMEMEVVASSPFSKVQAPAFLEEVLRQAGPEFTVAVGLALRKLQEQ